MIIASHGIRGLIQIGNGSGYNGVLTGNNIEEYMRGELAEGTQPYRAMKVFDIIREHIVENGNILFLGCKNTASVQGAISDAFPKYFTQKEKIVRMLFNQNDTANDSDILANKLYMKLLWDKDLTLGSVTPSWKFNISAKEESDIKKKFLHDDFRIKKWSPNPTPPYENLIYQVTPPNDEYVWWDPTTWSWPWDWD